MNKDINNLVGSDSANYHPLNITTCKEVEMSKFIYDALKTCSFKKSVSSFIKNNPELFKYNNKKKLLTNGYGPLNSFYGKKHSKKLKQWLSEKQTGVPIHNEEWKKELSRRWKNNTLNGFKGKKHTEESKKLIRLKRAIQIITEDTKKKMSLAHKERWRKINEKKLLKLTRG